MFKRAILILQSGEAVTSRLSKVFKILHPVPMCEILRAATYFEVKTETVSRSTFNGLRLSQTSGRITVCPLRLLEISRTCEATALISILVGDFRHWPPAASMQRNHFVFRNHLSTAVDGHSDSTQLDPLRCPNCGVANPHSPSTRRKQCSRGRVGILPAAAPAPSKKIIWG